MSQRNALLLTTAVTLAVAMACSDAGDDDDCPDCWESTGGSITFPPTPPTTGGPEPSGGTSTGGVGGDTTGGLGGTVTGGLGGVITGGVGPEGGTAGTGAFGNEGGTLAGGTSSGGALNGGTFNGGSLNGGVGGTL